MKKRLYLIVGILIVFLLVFLFFFLKNFLKEEIIWTKENSLSKISLMDIEDCGNYNDLLTALNKSLIYFNKKDRDKTISFGKTKYKISEVIESIEDFRDNLIKKGLNKDFFKYIKENYNFYQSNADKILFTGYYEASLLGSYLKNEEYRYPLYKKPDNLVKIDLTKFPFYKEGKGYPKQIKGLLVEKNKIIPVYDRKEIDDNGKLDTMNLELVYVKNPINLFFLQIQGSGIIKMTNGDSIRVNYSESNGHPYRPIGKYLVDMGYMKLQDVSMQSIRKFLTDNPNKMRDVFNYNPSYVFFRTVEDGPIGSIGVPLTAFRSIATDSDIFPKGAICYIETKLPVFDKKGKIISRKIFRRFVLNQDTGGAIRSAGRVDVFTGFGPSAEMTAGHLREHGRLFFLIKKRSKFNLNFSSKL